MTKQLWLTREQATWLSELIDNTPYDESLDKMHRHVIVSLLYKLEQEWSS